MFMVEASEHCRMCVRDPRGRTRRLAETWRIRCQNAALAARRAGVRGGAPRAPQGRPRGAPFVFQKIVRLFCGKKQSTKIDYFRKRPGDSEERTARPPALPGAGWGSGGRARPGPGGMGARPQARLTDGAWASPSRVGSHSWQRTGWGGARVPESGRDVRLRLALRRARTSKATFRITQIALATTRSASC